MDAAVAKVIATTTTLVGELDDSMGVFRDELAALLSQLQASHTNQLALQEKAKALTTELDAARMAHTEVKQEEDDLSNALKQLRDDIGRLNEEAAKARITTATSEAALRELKAKIAALEATKEMGAGWTPDQRAQQEALVRQKDIAMSDLAAKQAHLATLRAEAAVLTGQLEALQASKAEADATIAGLKDQIADAKTRTHGAQRAKDAAERELRELQEAAVLVRHDLSDKTKASESGAAELAASQEALRHNKLALDRCLKDFDKLRAR